MARLSITSADFGNIHHDDFLPGAATAAGGALQRLDLQGSAGLLPQHFRALKHRTPMLVELVLRDCNAAITDELVAALSGLGSLTLLDLSVYLDDTDDHAAVPVADLTDSALDNLSKLTNLRSLYLGAYDHDVLEFAGAPECRLHAFTDHGLSRMFAALQSLTSLSLAFTQLHGSHGWTEVPPNLQRLDLRGALDGGATNWGETSDVKRVLRSFGRASVVTHLDISDMPGLTLFDIEDLDEWEHITSLSLPQPYDSFGEEQPIAAKLNEEFSKLGKLLGMIARDTYWSEAVLRILGDCCPTPNDGNQDEAARLDEHAADVADFREIAAAICKTRSKYQKSDWFES